MKRSDEDLENLFDFLVTKGPFEGDSWALAQACHMPHDRLWVAINHARSAEFVADNAWTIPFVTRGPYTPKFWRVADMSDDAEVLADSAAYRGRHVVEHLRRVHAQVAHGTKLADRRTKQGRWLHAVEASLEAMVAQGEMVFAGDNGRE